MMKMAIGEGSPSGRVPEQGPDWFLVATEACGGGTPDVGYVLEVSVFIGIFGVGLMSGGVSGLSTRQAPPRACPPRARPPPLWAPRGSPDVLLPPIYIYPYTLKTFGSTIDQEFRHQKPP